ncbi:fumarylacetoacetate hydrolase [Cryobacterium sp. TMT1-2-2]|uniref:fumarylacetoacetate hydrolase family protein n=1 Tax=Cryobacterium sp. TMT1-2-2 TaxID=1259233 RepID=UPI00106923B7|nr:fumarylacetoacetate hydrolase family protein [Cryobacterium sp. TMT1-2-2]TFD09762.1 fumarylacetoacetate hydrolase [Cryobacterium sp. TMT1-2-2]
MSGDDYFGILPLDPADAHLVGRVWDPRTGGPRVVSVRGGQVYDLTDTVNTVSELIDRTDAVDIVASCAGQPRWHLSDLVAASVAEDLTRPHLLAPIDLQVVKACGVTFVESMIERVIEEKCAGDSSRAAEVRTLVLEALGGSLASLRPGSEAAARTKEVLLAQGMWSQYLEVGIGPDPEVFTKAPVLSSVGFGARVGIPTFSAWSNPEPELVLVADSRGEVRGATLGNDVNLRDVEGRSALLLGMAKDNNASSAIGPFIRLFDSAFTIDTLRTEEIALTVSGVDGYSLQGQNSVARISRPFEELVAATRGAHHQYPDGFALFTGTLFSPTQDRGDEGLGFTHEPGDIVNIQSQHLGSLQNVTGITEELPPWTFGIRALHRYLANLLPVEERV